MTVHWRSGVDEYVVQCEMLISIPCNFRTHNTCVEGHAPLDADLLANLDVLAAWVPVPDAQRLGGHAAVVIIALQSLASALVWMLEVLPW